MPKPQRRRIIAVLYITEYADVGVSAGRAIQAPAEPNLAEQTVAIGGASAQSAAFNAKTRVVMLHTDAICSIKFGTNPTATTSTARMAAGETRFYMVPKDESYKVAVITNT